MKKELEEIKSDLEKLKPINVGFSQSLYYTQLDAYKRILETIKKLEKGESKKLAAIASK